MLLKTQAKGELACLKFDSCALEKGGITSKPIIDVPYDRILDIDGSLFRIQVKYADHLESKSQGAMEIDLRRSTRKGKILLYKEGEVDALVIYIPKIDKLCWINPREFLGKQTIALRFLPTKSNQVKKCLMVDDYIW